MRYISLIFSSNFVCSCKSLQQLSGIVQLLGTATLGICGGGTFFVASCAGNGAAVTAGFGVNVAGFAGVNKPLLEGFDVGTAGLTDEKKLALDELGAGPDEDKLANGFDGAFSV